MATLRVFTYPMPKEAQDNGIDPDDIRLALDTIMRLRKGK